MSACLGNLDWRLTRLALRMVQRYAEQRKDDKLRAVGKAMHERHPRLWELGQALGSQPGLQGFGNLDCVPVNSEAGAATSVQDDRNRHRWHRRAQRQ